MSEEKSISYDKDLKRKLLDWEEIRQTKDPSTDEGRKHVSRLLNEVSPSFCMAKWTQLTLDLVHGTNHSCHHPKRHIIDIDEIRNNPSALHNTSYKKEVRSEMLEGKRPSECQYCWNIEDTPGEHYSDRVIKSSDPWSFPYFEKVLDCGSTGNYNPHYLEVMFDKACNFSCSYCMADISSSIQKEMNDYGPYPLFFHHHRENDNQWKRDLSAFDENPFVEAFWNWLPDIWQGLHTLRITGGEPLLSKHTYRLLDYISLHPQKNLTFAINSNLGIDDERIGRYLKKVKEIKEKGALFANEIYVSVDTYGEQAEYIRQGLNFGKFQKNLELILDMKACDRMILMVTFNLLSVPQFKDLLEYVVKLKEKHPELILDLSYLRDPEYLRANLLKYSTDREVWFEEMKECLLFMKENSNSFSEHEMNKLDRIYQWMKATEEESSESSIMTKKMMADFYVFVNEYDKRYRKNFIEVFPELRTFYIECKKEKFLQSFDKS